MVGGDTICQDKLCTSTLFRKAGQAQNDRKTHRDPLEELTFKLSFEGSDEPLLLSEPQALRTQPWGPSKPLCYMKERAAHVTGTTFVLFCEFYCIVLWCEPAPEGRDGSRVWQLTMV